MDGLSMLKISQMFLDDINSLNWGALTLFVLVLFFVFFIWQQTIVKKNWLRFSSLNFFIVAFLAALLTAFFFVSTYHAGVGGAFLAIALGVGVALSLVHPVIAVSFFLSNLLIRPWEFASLVDETIMMCMPKGLAVVCIASWFIYCFRKRHFYFIWNNTWSLFVLFIIWLFICAIVGGEEVSASTMAEFEGAEDATTFLFQRFFPVLVLFFLIFNSAHNEDEVRLIEVSLLISVIGLMISSEVFLMNNPEIERLAGGVYFGNANDLAALILMTFPFLFLPLKKHKFFTWILIIASGVIMLLALQWADSRAAKLAFAASIAVFFLIRYKISFVKLVLGGAIGIVALMFMMRTSRDASDLAMSSSSRLNYAITGFKMVKANPLFGIGLNNYPKLYEKYTSNFDEYGERTAHSSWILIMSEAGIPGLFLFAMLFYSTFRRVWRIRKTHPEFLMSFTGYGLAMSVLSHTYSMLPYIIVPLCLVGYRVFYEDVERQRRISKYER